MTYKPFLNDDKIALIADECDKDSLPGDLSEIAEFIGIHNAIKLAARLGCGWIYLSKWIDESSCWSDEIHRMVDVIGRENTATIARLFNGSWINIPKCDSLFLKCRNSIITRQKGKKTNVELAREYGLSKRHIKRITNATKDDNQTELF